MILMGLTSLYAIKGGMISVVITEVMQFIILTVTSITTVGYREVHELSPAGQIFTMILLLGGVGTVFYVLTLMVAGVVVWQATQVFVGCYVLHLSSPGAQGVPPFQPLAIQSATVQQVANNADINALLQTACPQQ